MTWWSVGTAAVTTGINAYTGDRASRRARDAQAEATDTQAQVAREQMALIEDRYQDTKATLQPFIDAGGPAIDRQRALLGLPGGDVTREEAFDAAYAGPAFAYRRDRIIDDINRGASARGQLRSGNRLVELSKRLNELYATQGNNYFNQLGSLGGYGLSAAQANAGVGTSAAAGQAQALGGVGDAAINRGNAIANQQMNSAAQYQSGVSAIGDALSDWWTGRPRRDPMRDVGNI